MFVLNKKFKYYYASFLLKNHYFNLTHFSQHNIVRQIKTRIIKRSVFSRYTNIGDFLRWEHR